MSPSWHPLCKKPLYPSFSAEHLLVSNFLLLFIIDCSLQKWMYHESREGLCPLIAYCRCLINICMNNLGKNLQAEWILLLLELLQCFNKNYKLFLNIKLRITAVYHLGLGAGNDKFFWHTLHSTLYSNGFFFKPQNKSILTLQLEKPAI